MVVQDIVHSCSNEYVAEAALASIGGVFARRVRETACRRGVRPGALAATAVLGFRTRAKATELAALQKAVTGVDQPLLQGFRLIVESALPDSLEVQRSA
jgi:hypothetical protein